MYVPNTSYVHKYILYKTKWYNRYVLMHLYNVIIF